HFHQPDSLAITLWTGHSKIMFEPTFGIRAFFVADDADTVATKAAKAADNRSVVAELAVTGERNKAVDQAGDVVEAVRSLRMPGDLGFLQGCKLGIKLLQCQRGFRFEPIDFFADGDSVSCFAHRAQFLDLGLEFGHRFFEVEIAAHWIPCEVFSK